MIIGADYLTTIREVAKEVNVQHSGLLTFEANWEGEKTHKWVPRELTTNQKNYCFEVPSSFYSRNSEPFLNQIVMYDEKWILYNNWQ